MRNSLEMAEDIFIYRKHIPKENRFCFKTYKKGTKNNVDEDAGLIEQNHNIINKTTSLNNTNGCTESTRSNTVSNGNKIYESTIVNTPTSINIFNESEKNDKLKLDLFEPIDIMPIKNGNINPSLDSSKSMKRTKSRRNLLSTKPLTKRSSQEYDVDAFNEKLSDDEEFLKSKSTTLSHSSTLISPKSLDALCSKYNSTLNDTDLLNKSANDEDNFKCKIKSNFKTKFSFDNSNKVDEKVLSDNMMINNDDDFNDHSKNMSTLIEEEEFFLLEQEKEWLKDIDFEEDICTKGNK